MTLRIAVFGTGAVGGYFGARLAQAGQDVTFITRGENLRAIRQGGLRVESVAGDFVLHPAMATDRPEEVGVVDVVLVGVKAWQVTAAAKAIRPLVGAHTLVLPLQNGVEAAAELSAVLGPDPVLGGLCKIIASLVAPGHVRHTGIDPVVEFGERDKQRNGRVEQLRAAFAATTGVTAHIPANIHVALWQKFMLIAPWSGIGAITRAPVGVFRSQPESRALLQAALQEVYTVARAHQVDLPPDSVATTLAFIDGLPTGGTASMQRDIINGVPSELEQQNGAVVRLGQEVGAATPINAFIYGSLIPLERRARQLLAFG